MVVNEVTQENLVSSSVNDSSSVKTAKSETIEPHFLKL